MVCHTLRPVWMSSSVNTVVPEVVRTSVGIGGIVR
jgi:hypothetical protein